MVIGRMLTIETAPEADPYLMMQAANIRIALLEEGHTWAMSEDGREVITAAGLDPDAVLAMARTAGWKTDCQCMKPTCGKLYRRGKLSIAASEEYELNGKKFIKNKRRMYDFKACPHCGEKKRYRLWRENVEGRNG